MRDPPMLLPSQEFFDEVGEQFGVVLFAEVLDPLGLEIEVPECGDDPVPDLLAGFALRQIEFADQLAELLQRDRPTVLVEVADDFVLMFGSLRHRFLL